MKIPRALSYEEYVPQDSEVTDRIRYRGNLPEGWEERRSGAQKVFKETECQGCKKVLKDASEAIDFEGMAFNRFYCYRCYYDLLDE